MISVEWFFPVWLMAAIIVGMLTVIAVVAGGGFVLALWLWPGLAEGHETPVSFGGGAESSSTP